MSTNLPALLPLPAQAMADLAAAKSALERESLPIRLAALAGTPIENLKNRLPSVAQDVLDRAIRRALATALEAAMRSIGEDRRRGLRLGWLERGMMVASGVAGGTFGLPGTLVELPVSTTLLLRQIAAEAAEAGEDLRARETALECLKVFALGGAGVADDASETGYFATRLALARFLPNLSAAVLPGLIRVVAARFAGPVLIKMSVQAAPLLGAAAGGTVNLAFFEHFRKVARAHFTIRRLEREHGLAAVQLAYQSLRSTA